MKTLLFLYLFSASIPAMANFSLTNSLAKPNRELILKTLGLGTLSKNLSQPNPLGADLELSISTEMINTEKIERFISESQGGDVLYYPKISIGKGLYDRFDFFFHFIPFTSTLGISEFGALVRYNFYKSESSPFVASILGHGNSANFNNQLTTRNVGTDLSLGMNLGLFSFSGAFGWGRSTGSFTAGVTDTLTRESESAQSIHFAVGTQLTYSIYTMALSLDHYSEAVYSAKLGVIF